MGTLVWALMGLSLATAQEEVAQPGTSKEVFVQFRGGWLLPLPVGNNFLSEAYEVNPGVMADLDVLFNEHYVLGYQGTFHSANVTNTGLVGRFDRSRIQRHYLTGSYSFLSPESRVGLIAGTGIGYVRYGNKKENIKFYEDGFSAMVRGRLTYRFSSYFGWHAGLQYSRDFLNTETAPELRSFFRNAHTFYISTGLVIFFGE
ncbi:hypothetical protein ACKWCC_01655 [Maribacter sp. 2307ULW6-5]